MYEPRLTSDESREDFRVLVGARSSLAAVCLGPVRERGEPHESALWTIARTSAWPGEDSAAIEHDQVASEHAVRYRVVLPEGVLTEWKFAHDAWLFVAGVYCVRGDDELEALGLARRVLSTWRWVRHEDAEDLAGYSC